jgi:hypothetical protein
MAEHVGVDIFSVTDLTICRWLSGSNTRLIGSGR